MITLQMLYQHLMDQGYQVKYYKNPLIRLWETRTNITLNGHFVTAVSTVKDGSALVCKIDLNNPNSIEELEIHLTELLNERADLLLNY